MCGIKNMHDKFLFCIIKYGKSGLTTFRSRYRVFSMPSGIHETPRSRQGRAGESLPPRDAILEEWRPAGALSNLLAVTVGSLQLRHSAPRVTACRN